ncbi:hypothetical protein CBOM_07839 [Ceraceosorus bombacis]|uniref:Uncharacterized protein n=1 Tax=Ceraceosorus bombacis TaxID=401625 RepID=A0A0P1BNX0_9BASI|nr:hypothetical protein CBOM_07839 [Ceraceosorus bombacis]
MNEASAIGSASVRLGCHTAQPVPLRRGHVDAIKAQLWLPNQAGMPLRFSTVVRDTIRHHFELTGLDLLSAQPPAARNKSSRESL